MTVSRKLLSIFALSLAMLLPICSAFSYSVANMTCEDFTTYTEVEPDDRIQSSTSHIDAYLARNEDTYLYMDKGVDHFGDFVHHINVRCKNTTGDSVSASPWVVSNDIDDIYHQRHVDNEYCCIEFYRTWKDNLIILLGYWNGSMWHNDNADFEFAYDTWYYFRIERKVTDLECKIYNTGASRDAESTDEHLLDALNVTVIGSARFRYIYGCCSYDLSPVSFQAMNLEIECLDLQETTTAPVGGTYIPIDKVSLLAPYIGLALLLIAAIVTVVFFKHKKRKSWRTTCGEKRETWKK